MSVDVQKETLGFQAEVQQLLRLVAHSLYSNKEVFLRELISNASDAGDKLRFEALQDSSLYENDPDICIRVHFDKEARTLTIADNGIGMSRQEVIDNIGTIARSGTRQFMQNLSGDQAKDANLIGQFGVGFYSSFIVADKVTLITRRAGASADEGVRWESNGEGEYTIESVEKPSRGTEVILHLREEEEDVLNEWRLRSIITKYSDHITFPVIMPVQKFSDDKDAPPTIEDERINQAAALWARPKQGVTEEEYKTFYKHVAHDFEEPLAWTHNKLEGKLEYTSLLFIPGRAPFDLWDREQRHGVKLFVQRVFIMDDAEHLMPRYLRFIRGVIDSNDLPLNVSRELLQSSKVVDNIRSGSVKKVLGLLEDLAQNHPEKYAKFWKEFGRVLKEGPAEDYANREQVAKLLLFASTHTDTADPKVTLADYISRMKEGQQKIYYLVADSFAAAKNSPHLEIFRKKGVEVLLLSDRVDEWLMSHLHEYDGKPLQSVAKGVLELDQVAADAEKEKEEQQQAQDEYKDILKRIQDVLGETIKEVRISSRLTTSPACVVVEENALSVHLERLLRDSGQPMPMNNKPSLEINPQHGLVVRLKAEADDTRFADWTHLLFEQALLAEGGHLEDPNLFVQRLNRLLLSMC